MILDMFLIGVSLVGWRGTSLTHHLLSFFLNFVLRNCVELVKKELPLTYKIRQALPNVLSDGCKECFGQKGSLHAYTSMKEDTVTLLQSI
jgi:hypothetical protein